MYARSCRIFCCVPGPSASASASEQLAPTSVCTPLAELIVPTCERGLMNVQGLAGVVTLLIEGLYERRVAL